MNDQPIMPPSGDRSAAFRTSLGKVLGKHGIAESTADEAALAKPELIPVETFEDGSARIEQSWFQDYKRKARAKADHQATITRMAAHLKRPH